MTLAMTSIPLDSFLPSGATRNPSESLGFYHGYPHEPRPIRGGSLVGSRETSELPTHNGHYIQNNYNRQHNPMNTGTGSLNSRSSSIASSLTLPHSTSHLASIDEHPSVDLTLSGDDASQQGRLISPTRFQSPQSDGNYATATKPTSSITSPLLSPFSELAVASSTEQTSHQLRRMTSQNRRLIENWEAERAHLEANRARAEEIYKEEIAIMDEERSNWQSKEHHFLTNLADLQHALELRGTSITDEERLEWTKKEQQLLARMVGLEQRNAQLEKEKLDLSQTLGAVRAGFRATSPSNIGNGNEDGVGVGVLFRNLSESISPGSTAKASLSGSGSGPGHTMPQSDPLAQPLDPRMQGTGSSPDCGSPCQSRVASIDVQQIHPELEGIPLRSTAIKKETFTDGCSHSTSNSNRSSSSGSNRTSSPVEQPKSSSAELTARALRATEFHRLTMHAGHTPNHSVTRFPTATGTEASNTAGSTGTSTPTHQSRELDSTVVPPTQEIPRAPQSSLVPTMGVLSHVVGVTDDMKPTLCAEEDPDLKGPLTLRNIPAHDEVFLKTVDGLLDNSLKSDNATPTVMKNSTDDDDDDRSVATAKEDQEEDIPLRLKITTNFGAPLGNLR